MYRAIPLWKSQYSLGKSILTLYKAGESKEDEPQSIIDLAKGLGLKRVTLVDDSISGFLEAQDSCLKSGLELQFGLKVVMCENIDNKTDESRNKEHKVVIFSRNEAGDKRMIKISTLSCCDGFYYYPRLDFARLKELWDDKDLLLGIPFYDSFIFNNNLTYGACVPDFGAIHPIFFLEDNNLPFDHIVKARVLEYAGDRYKTFQAQSIYYNKREDFLAYLTNRCIAKRTTLNKPNIEHCSSDEFCVEAFKEKYV